MKILHRSFILFLFTFSLCQLQAQQDSISLGSKVKVKMKSGKYFEGVLIENGEEKLVIESPYGLFTLQADRVRRLEPENYTGEFAYEKSVYTRYFVAPSAFPIEQGKGLYDNHFVLINAVTVGFTKNFSFGGGFEWVNALNDGDLEYTTWFAQAKFSFQLSEKFHLAYGVLSTSQGSDHLSLVIYVATTYGTPDANITIGLNRDIRDDYFDNPLNALTLSGSLRITDKLSLISENHFNLNQDSPSTNKLSYSNVQGIQINPHKYAFRLGILLGSILELPIVPYVGFTRVF